MSKQLISIIIPVYNEEENIEHAYQAIVDEFKKNPQLNYEIIFTDNHSSDGTFDKISSLAAHDTRVRVLRFSRNFGFQRSILTGYRYASGDAAIQIDCDLEDPPNLFSEFIRLWQLGHDVVVGIRSQRTENPMMIAMRRIYYQVLDKISETPHLVDAGDFRLVDRKILNQLRSIDDMQPYVRGLISELAKNQIGIHYVRNTRKFGKSKFPLKQLIKMGLDGVFAYSITPLRIATYIGLITTFLTVIMLSFYIIFGIYFFKHWPAGFTTTTVLILFGISMNALFLGIIGEYVGRIYTQIRKRPTVIIEEARNISLDLQLLS